VAGIEFEFLNLAFEGIKAFPGGSEPAVNSRANHYARLMT
jgi:hypothetical protein